MIVFRISKTKYANDLTGYGSYLYGGRWSPKGISAVYTSLHRSLAYLEFLVHQLDRDSTPKNMMISSIEIKNASLLERVNALPENWKSLEYNTETQAIASSCFANNKLGLIVPSVIITNESNVILNPGSSQFKKNVRIIDSKSLQLDKRFYGPF